MKILIAALTVFCGSLAVAQELPPPSPAPTPLPTVSGTSMDASQVLPQGAKSALNVEQVVQASKALPSGPWVGKLDLKSLPELAAYQSVISPDQAIGFHKNLWSLWKGEYEIVRVGGFFGWSKPMFSEPGASARTLGGATVLVPGSALDWAMGTNYGQAWLPNLKTGWLFAYDVSRLKSIGVKPDFTGPGISYSFGGASAK